MGAAASVGLIYKDAVDWFREYFDAQSYVADFHAIDKDHDGGIRYEEFVAWLQARAAKEGGAWRFFVSHPEIVAVAHLQSSRDRFNTTTFRKERIVDINDFRALLIELFAVSVLWTHFKKADDWQSANRHDSYDGRLGIEECLLAVRTFCAAYGQEQLTDDQIRADFLALDTDGSGQLSLLEVCGLCSKFIDPETAESLLLNREAHNAPTNIVIADTPAEEVEIAENMTYVAQVLNDQDLAEEHAVEERQDVEKENGLGSHSSTKAMEEVVQEVNKNSEIADLVEMRMATERDLEQVFNSSVQDG